MMNSLEGHLLIASPRMSDPRFDRTVVLMLKHDESGAVGIILNRPMKERSRGPWQMLSVLADSANRRVQIGGPVAGPLIVLHEKNEDDIESNNGVFVIEKPEQLESIIEDSDVPLQFFIGHAGWNGGQLETEVAQGAWLTTPAEPGFVFGEHDDMWVSALRENGRSFYRNVLGIDEFPHDASMN